MIISEIKDLGLPQNTLGLFHPLIGSRLLQEQFKNNLTPYMTISYRVLRGLREKLPQAI